MLYEHGAFEPLTDEPWDEKRVRHAIRGIVSDTDAALRGPKLLWPAHEWDGWRAAKPMKNLYVGAAGVFLALDELRRRGHAETRLDLADLAGRNVELFRTRPDYMKGEELMKQRACALLCGEAGVLLVAWRLAPDGGLADDLLALVRANVDNEADEVMWGTPGTLIAARAMLASTGEERWRDAIQETAEVLWSRREDDGLWVQRLYGQEFRALGTVHGLVGNVQALAPALDDERRAALERETAAILQRTAVVEDALANWPATDRPTLPTQEGRIPLQWCHGAPGIVVAAAGYIEESLLLAGAELCWQAGAHGDEKGASICHGTAGNGYALLAAFARTGDERWLERARRFAVHSLAQTDRLRAERGCGRYSLFTGDLGVALYAADCLEARTAFPVLGATL